MGNINIKKIILEENNKIIKIIKEIAIGAITGGVTSAMVGVQNTKASNKEYENKPDVSVLEQTSELKISEFLNICPQLGFRNIQGKIKNHLLSSYNNIGLNKIPNDIKGKIVLRTGKQVIWKGHSNNKIIKIIGIK